MWILKHKDFIFLSVVPNPFSPGALFFFGAQILVTGLITCRGRCSTGSLPVIKDMEENLSYMGLHVSADELGPWLKHPQGGGPYQLSPAMPSETHVQRVHGRQSFAGSCFRYRFLPLI